MKKTVFSAIFTISLFTVADRALGFVFKIFLSRELGAATLGVYQVALSLFFVLLTFTTSGIPLIVSKLTARYRIENAIKKERALTSAALILGLIVAFVVIAAVALLRKPLGSLFADRESSVVLVLLLPALAFSAVYSAFRGNLWGRQRYFCVSLVEILEQIARILACVALIAVGFNKLYATALSLSIGCFVSMAVVTVCYFAGRGRLAPPSGQLLPLLRSSAPITVSRAASSVVGSLEALVVPFLLLSSGFTREQSMALYGAGVGMALPLLYIPITVVGSLAFVMIPTVSTGMAQGKTARVSAQIESAIGFSAVVAALFVPAFTALGGKIGALVYGSEVAGGFLSSAAWLLVPLSVENITSSVMNSLDLEIKSFLNYLVGSALTFAVCFAFYGCFDITVLAYAMGAGLTLTCVLHILCIRKRTGLGFSYLPKAAKSAVLCVPAAFLAKCVCSLCEGLGSFGSIALGTLASMAVFGLLAYALGMVDVDFFRSGIKPSAPRKTKARHFRRKTLAKRA